MNSLALIFSLSLCLLSGSLQGVYSDAVIAAIKEWYAWVYALLLFAFPYLHRIPAISRVLDIIPSKAWQVAIIGVLLGLAIFKMGVGDSGAGGNGGNGRIWIKVIF